MKRIIHILFLLTITFTAVKAQIIVTVAGGGVGDGGPATGAVFSGPSGVCVDATGNMYVADQGNSIVRKIDVSGNVSTYAGIAGITGYYGDGGAATASILHNPTGVALDNAGNLLIADGSNNRVRMVNRSTGIITTIAGNGIAGFTGDGTAATGARLNYPYALAVDATGNIYIADNFNYCIRKVDKATGNISTFAGTGGVAGYSNGAATASKMGGVNGLAFDNSGNLYIADNGNSCIRKVDASTLTVSTYAGTGTVSGYFGDGGAATSAKLYAPSGLAVDGSNNLYIADCSNNRIRMVSPSGIISTVAGTGIAGFLGDGSSATGAEFYNPDGLAIDGSGNLVITDYSNSRVRKMVSGVINTIAGTGTGTFIGDGLAATSAELYHPTNVVVDGGGNLLIADALNLRVRKVDFSSGAIRTIAGGGSGGDGGPATAANLYPTAITVDGLGQIYIADAAANKIRKVDTITGIISTFAGGGTGGLGDWTIATAATLNNPMGVIIDHLGNMYVAKCDTMLLPETPVLSMVSED